MVKVHGMFTSVALNTVVVMKWVVMGSSHARRTKGPVSRGNRIYGK